MTASLAAHDRRALRGVRTAATWIVLALLVASCPAAYALAPGRHLTQYVHDAWTSNEGLPQDSINSIAQTPDGYLWVATQEGIARFDGVRFTVFDSRTTGHKLGNFVYALHVDHRGTLWIGASSGMLRYDGGNTFTLYDQHRGWHGSAAKFISEDRDGNLWASAGTGSSSGGKGLIRFHDGAIRIFTTRDGLAHDQVYETAPDPDGALWIGTGAGLNVFRNGRFSLFTTADGLPDNLVRVVHRDRSGSIWAGTPHGLSRYANGRFQTFTTRDGLLDDDVVSMTEDRDGALWVGTVKGLSRFANGKFEPATGIAALGDDRIFGIFEDREGSLWIGTHSAGLHRLRAGKFSPIGPPEGLEGSSASGIFEDRNGAMWIGTAPGGVTVFDRGTIARYSPANGLPASSVKAFAQDRSGAMWIGTPTGLVRFKDRKFALMSTGDDAAGNNINCILETRDGTLWVGTEDGLARSAGGAFERVPLSAHVAPNSVRVLHEARDGRLWIAGGDGLGYLQGGRFVPVLERTIRDVNIQSLHEDGDGTLWLTSWGAGLFRLRKGRVTQFTPAAGLFDESIWSIVDDGRRSFWCGSNRGIFRVARQQLNDFADGRTNAIACVVYGTSDGMRSRETNAGSPAALRARDGRLWFATTAGVVVIDPAHIATNKLAPNVVIQRVAADDHELPIAGQVSIAPGARSFEIDYAALTFVAPASVRYRYKLEGFDREWVDAGPRRSAYYTNIAPGTYTFHVIAANADGVWNARGAALPIRLRPFFYQTWWFALLIAAAVVLLALGIRAARVRQLAIRHEAYHDPMTGLPNRRLLTQRAEVALTQAERRGRSIGILFLDLDGFKGVNDRLGHAAGDRLLKFAGDRFRACIREVDTLARIGGDEFAVLVADLADESRAAEVAQRIIAATAADFVLDGQRVKLGVSIGIAFHPFDGADVNAILRAADRAMYRAKLSGGNAYEFNAADPSELVTI